MVRGQSLSSNPEEKVILSAKDMTDLFNSGDD